MILLPVAVCVAAVVGLLFAEKTGSLAGVWLTKPVAAASYVWFALSLGALESAYGRWLLAGLATCLLGDIFLIPRRREWFRAGIVAFLAGHLFYIVAFAQLRIAVAGVGYGHRVRDRVGVAGMAMAGGSTLAGIPTSGGDLSRGHLLYVDRGFCRRCRKWSLLDCRWGHPLCPVGCLGSKGPIRGSRAHQSTLGFAHVLRCADDSGVYGRERFVTYTAAQLC